MVFDVESVGLHGEGFAAGWVVVDDMGGRLGGACYACDPNEAKGHDVDRKWVAKNIPVPHVGYNCRTPKQVRDEFWRAWSFAKDKGAMLVADCAWPVEARFLIACIEDDANVRNWNGPYPLIDVGSVLLAKGKDPLGKFPRLAGELPEHDPFCDAKQSARIFIEALKS
jgi:hypothetical protein